MRPDEFDYLILVSMNEQIESGKSKKYFFHK
jgi:hypothetical protein